MLFVILARIGNLAYALWGTTINLHESPFIPDQLKSSMQIPFVVLLVYYALILGFVIIKLKQIDRYKIYPVFILGYVVISTTIIDSLIYQYIRELAISNMTL